MAKANEWSFKPGSAGWGTHESMLAAMEAALKNPPFLLGETFSMADVIFGGTLRFMLGFNMIEKRPAFTEYAERLGERAACQRADEINQKSRAEHGLK